MGSELYVSQTIYINISQLIVEIRPVSRAALGKLCLCCKPSSPSALVSHVLREHAHLLMYSLQLLSLYNGRIESS